MHEETRKQQEFDIRSWQAVLLSLPTSQETHAQPESKATSCRPSEGGVPCLASLPYHTRDGSPPSRGRHASNLWVMIRHRAELLPKCMYCSQFLLFIFRNINRSNAMISHEKGMDVRTN